MQKIIRIAVMLLVSALSNLVQDAGVFAAESDSLVKSNPSYILSTYYPRVKQPNARLEDYLMLNRACIYLGKYYMVDSLLDHVFTHYSFENDSALYIDFLGVEYENKKILEMYEESLSNLYKILDYTQRKGNTNDLVEVYLKFVEYYRAASNFDLAVLYLNKITSVESASSKGISPFLKARTMNRKAAVFQERAVYMDSVEWLSKEVIQSLNKHNSLNLVASSCNELGFLYLNTNKPGAEYYFRKAIAIWETLGYSNSLHNAQLNLARYYIKVHEADKAIKLALVCIKITRENGWIWDEGYWNEILSIAYEQLGDYKRALYYLNIAKDGLLKISTTQYKERLAYYSNKLELKRREEELVKKSLEIERVNNEMILKSRENESLFIFISVLFAGLLGTLLFLWLTIRQKRMVKLQKEEIGNINKQLEQLLDQKETLIKEVNHRVKNNLSILAGLMYLKEKELKDKTLVGALRDMQGRINSISLIHETLYQRDDVERINFQEYLERLSSQIMELYPDEKKVQISIKCFGFKPELSIAMPLSMMVNELMTNSLKYAFRDVVNKEIYVQYDADKHELSYSDNGPGYVFNVSSSSLGLKLLHILSTQINADLRSSDESGRQRVYITLKNHEL